MFHRYRLALIAFVLIVPGCGGSSPTAPTGTESGSGSFNGMTLNALDGQPISGVTVKIGSQTAVSDSSGAYQMENPGSGFLTATLTGSSIVERRTVVTMQSGESLRQTLIPASFDIVAFDQMFRTDNQLKRWTTAPALVVLTTVLNYTQGLGSSEEYYATSEQLTEAETTLLIEQLTEALGLLTGNTFRTFASVERESVRKWRKGQPVARWEDRGRTLQRRGRDSQHDWVRAVAHARERASGRWSDLSGQGLRQEIRGAPPAANA